MNFWSCLKCRRWQDNKAWSLRLKNTSTTSWLRWLCSHRSKKKRLLKVVLQRDRESRCIEQGQICTCTHLLMHAPCKNITSREGNDWMVCRNKVKGCVWGGGGSTRPVWVPEVTLQFTEHNRTSRRSCIDVQIGSASNHSIIYYWSLTVCNCYDSWFSLPPLILSHLQSISLFSLQYNNFSKLHIFYF